MSPPRDPARLHASFGRRRHGSLLRDGGQSRAGVVVIPRCASAVPGLAAGSRGKAGGQVGGLPRLTRGLGRQAQRACALGAAYLGAWLADARPRRAESAMSIFGLDLRPPVV